MHVIVLSRTGSVNAEYEFPLPLCVCVELMAALINVKATLHMFPIKLLECLFFVLYPYAKCSRGSSLYIFCLSLNKSVLYVNTVQNVSRQCHVGRKTVSTSLYKNQVLLSGDHMAPCFPEHFFVTVNQEILLKKNLWYSRGLQKWD